MAKVVTVAQQKGGAGKTTLVIQLATALAGAGRRVALVDIDPQGSLTGWMRLREHRQRDVPELRFSMVAGWRLGVELDRLKREADVIVVDTPPHTEIDAKAAIRGADLVLVPCQPSSLDIWASQGTVELAAKEKRRVALVLNRVPPRGRSIEEARHALAELGAPALTDPDRQPPGLRHQRRPGPGRDRERAQERLGRRGARAGRGRGRAAALAASAAQPAVASRGGGGSAGAGGGKAASQARPAASKPRPSSARTSRPASIGPP